MTESQRLMRHIDRCTQFNPSLFVPFIVAEKEVGHVRRELALFIGQEAGFFIRDDRLMLAPLTDSIEARTAALRRVSDVISDYYNVPLVGEIYPVIQKWGDIPLAHIDRAAIPWFGVKGNGVHVNGYVQKGKDLFIWVAQRSKDRKIDPSKLDTLIGGGLPLGYSIEENLAKEAWEEAGLTAEQVAPAHAQGALTYHVEMMKGLRNDTLFVFDLELGLDVQPKNTDGEVERFELIPAKEVLGIIQGTDRFKFNCNVVMLDFMIRRGVIDIKHPEHEVLSRALETMRKA